MTRRFWQFSLIALFGTIIVAATLEISFERLIVGNLTQLSAEKNAAVARSLSNATRDQLRNLLSESTGLSRQEMRALEAASDLGETIAGQVVDLSVTKVNLFNRNSVTVFSTDRSLIGIRLPQNPGILGALGGDVVSDIVRQGSFNSHDQVVETQDLMQTYIPFPDDSGNVIGVFEVYSNVSAILTRISETRRGIVIGVTGILALFYALLVWLFGRTDQELVLEQAATQSYLEQIEAANATLESRVAERTRLLEESRNFLQAAIDGVPDPAIVIGSDYRITSMNKAARVAFANGHQAGEPLSCYRALHGRDSPCDDDLYPCTLKTGEPCKRVEARERSAGGEQHVEIRTTPLRGPDGKTNGAIEIAHDLNEREQIAFKLRQAKERAETENRVKSEFVAAMSHEIRTPMNAVMGMTDLLRLTDLTRKQQGYIQTIQSSGNMLLSLLDNILDFSMNGASALELQKREFKVLELLERVLEIVGYHAYSKGLELVGALDTDLSLRVSGDRNRLRQILVNLAQNAVKFSDDGQIVIRVGSETGSDGNVNLLVTVSDCGIGLSDEAKARLFTPFANVGQQLEGQQGSGLGLTICKQLVEQMGGEIGIDSEPGSGTRVWFSVPVEWSASAEDEFIPDQLESNGKQILATHVTAEIDQVISTCAMAYGMHCDIAASDDEALERLDTAARNGQPYAAAIIDMANRDSSGLELARRVRSADALRLLPIVLLTPISKPLEPGIISAIGGIRCLNKPILPSELLQCLQRLNASTRLAATDVKGHVKSGASNARLSILVAEDNPVNRQVLTGMLEWLGHAADCVEDGPAVLQALSERSYDMVLMDCQMPGMNGEKVTETIRHDTQRFPVQPLIFAVTADTSLENRSVCLAAGMDDFIAKPVRLGQLKEELQRWGSMLVACENESQDGQQDYELQGNENLLSHLRERTGSDDELFLSNYIDLFLQDTTARLDKLSAAIDRQDAVAITRECHSLKGACLEFGMSRMGRYCDDFRDSAETGNFAVVPQLMVVLKREFARIRPVFEAEKLTDAGRS